MVRKIPNQKVRISTRSFAFAQDDKVDGRWFFLKAIILMEATVLVEARF
jgi:hypothetical protein